VNSGAPAAGTWHEGNGDVMTEAERLAGRFYQAVDARDYVHASNTMWRAARQPNRDCPSTGRGSCYKSWNDPENW
jgi:hypothetical protein